nr:immunoglobulin light chain junction region [Macaca mulatta]
CQQYDSDSRTF